MRKRKPYFKALRAEVPELMNIATGREARPPEVDKFAAAFSIAGEPQQKVADEKKEILLEHFSGDPDVEEARAEIEYAQEIKEIFHKGFDGIGLG